MAATRTIIQTWNGTDWVVSTPATTFVLPESYTIGFGTTDAIAISSAGGFLAISKDIDHAWLSFSSTDINVDNADRFTCLSTQLVVGVGSAGTPALSFNHPTNTTGWFLSAGADLAASVDGTQRASFSTSTLTLSSNYSITFAGTGAATTRDNLGASSGIWPGSLGGTGVANTGKTITVSGNTTIGSSTHTVAFATGANTSVTLPSSGTLATLAGTEALTNKTINGSNNTITNVSLTTGVTGTLPVANGGTAFTAAPKVIAHPSTNQTLTSGGTTDTVAFGTEVVDTDNAFASNTFTVPSNQGGYYLISLSSLYLQSGGSSSGINVSIAVNGSAVARIYQQPIDAGFAWGAGGASLLSLSAGDAVTIKITQADGTAWDILGGISTLGRLTIHRVI